MTQSRHSRCQIPYRSHGDDAAKEASEQAKAGYGAGDLEELAFWKNIDRAVAELQVDIHRDTGLF